MILEPLVNNSLQFELRNKEKEFQDENNFFPKVNHKRERILEKKKQKLFSLKEKNRVKINLYFLVLIFFLIGIIVGSIVFRIFVEDSAVKEMIVEKFCVLENQKLSDDEIFKESFSRNLKILATFWFVGVSVVGAPLLVLLCFYKGFTTAFVISSFLLNFGFFQGNVFIFKRLFFYYIFLILAMVLLTASSIKVMINVLKYKKDIRLELIRHSIFTILGFIFMIFSTILETKFLQ